MPTPTAYVDSAYIKLVGCMPAADVDAVESLFPGVVDGVARAVSRMFDSRLVKRYAVPFDYNDPPEAIRWHVAQVVVYTLFQKRGYNPSSEQDGQIKQNRDDALAWLKEAADSKDGLIELPLKESLPKGQGVIAAAPKAATQTSPYVWTDEQATTGRAEDYR